MNSESSFAEDREAQETMEGSLAIFAVPFILGLGVVVFFILTELFRQIL